MDDARAPKEDPFTYKYVQILRRFLLPMGGWPGEAFGEKLLWFIRFHRKYIVFQTSMVSVGQILYLFVYWPEMDFLLKGLCVISFILGIVTLIRCCVINLAAYGKIIKTFLLDFNLGHFRHKGKYYQEIYSVIDKISYYFAIYTMCLIVAGPLLFNAAPFYQNCVNGYFSGYFTGKSRDNITPAFSIYLMYPGFEEVDHFTFFTILSFHASYLFSILNCSFDLIMSVMVFQIIGHIQILKHNLAAFPKPTKQESVTLHHLGQQSTITVAMYDSEENLAAHAQLVQCVHHHRMIVSFTEELSAFFGPVLGVNYASHLFCCCLLLLECATGGFDALVRLGPLTMGIFGQLIQISTIFEIVGTVSEKLKDSVYASPWECMDTRNRRSAAILLQRVQTPIRVTAAGLTTVGVTTMAAILRTTFSYFTFLLSMND